MMRTAALLAILPLAACGHSMSGLDTTEIQAFNPAAREVAAAAAAYGVQAASMPSLEACTGAQGAYDAQVRPIVSRMQGMGGSMDAMMAAMGHMDADDMGCSASAMMAELDRHRTMACASAGDMAPNQGEARQHVAAMTRWANHQMGRSQDMSSMAGMGMGMMGSGATAEHCVQAGGGTYELQP